MNRRARSILAVITLLASLSLCPSVYAGGLHGLFRHHSGLTVLDRADRFSDELSGDGKHALTCAYPYILQTDSISRRDLNRFVEQCAYDLKDYGIEAVEFAGYRIENAYDRELGVERPYLFVALFGVDKPQD